MDASAASRRASATSENEVVKPELLDAKKSKNLSIILRGIKISDDQILESVKNANTDLPSSLVTVLQDSAKSAFDQNISTLAAMLNSTSNLKLDRNEIILLQLAKLDDWRDALTLMSIKFQAQEAISGFTEQVKPLYEVCKVLMSAKELFNTMGCILYLGNYANQGTHRGNAYGLRVSSLKGVTSTKTTVKDYSLLDYLVESLSGSQQDQWLEFNRHLEPLERAVKGPISELEKHVAKLVECKEDLPNRDRLTSKSLLSSLDSFARDLDEHISSCKSQLGRLQETLKSTLAHFGEEYDRQSYEGFLGALLEFGKDTEQARRSLIERRLEAERKAKRAAQMAKAGKSGRAMSQEHKFGFVDNIMDRLRSEITAAAGRPTTKQPTST